MTHLHFPRGDRRTPRLGPCVAASCNTPALRRSLILAGCVLSITNPAVVRGQSDGTGAANEYNWAEPQLGSILPGTIERVAAQPREPIRENHAEPPRVPAEPGQGDPAQGDETAVLSHHARGTMADNESTHYARGSTLIMHVFIDWHFNEFANGYWDEQSRSEAGGKSYLAKQLYLDLAPANANISFDNQSSTTYWYISAFYPGLITEMNWEIADYALQQNGVVDADGDGYLADDFSLGLQNWNGGWDNVIVMFEPAGSASGIPHGEYHVSTVMIYPGNVWSTWAHEWGHVFGGCDEYINDGQCGFEDCDTCPLTIYCDELYYNGNCDLPCGDPGNPCIMKYGESVACSYTRQAWSWEDEDSNGQLDWVRRYSDTGASYDIMEMWNNGYFFHSTEAHSFAAHVTTPGWTVFGLRSPSTADYDLRLFGDNNLTYQYASSAWSGQEVDFIVGDYHVNRLGIEHLQADRYSGSASNYNIVWEGGGEVLYPDGVARPQNWIAQNVVRAYDVPLFAGETVTITLDVTSGSLDLAMALFTSYGTIHFVGRSAALWSDDQGGPGATEAYTYTVQDTDVYGLVVWTNNAVAGTFTIQVGPTPATLLEETPVYSGLDLRLYNYDPTVPYWAVVGSRPDDGGNVTLKLYDDAQYTIPRATSGEAGDTPELIAVDYSHAPINRDHIRVVSHARVNYRTEWEQSADLSAGYISGDWTSPHVAKVWDVYLEADQTYYFREYHPLFIPRLDAGLYLFDPGRDFALSKAQAAAGSDQYTASEGERFLYTAAISGFHGLAMVLNREVSDGYSIWWGPRFLLQDNQEKTSGNEIVYGLSSVVSNDWVVWGARPVHGDQVDAWNFGTDGEYAGWETSSSNVAGVNILVCDRNHLPQPEAVYTRFSRSVGSGSVDYEYEGGAGETVPYTEGGSELVTLTWDEGDVVEGYDIRLTGSPGEPAYLEIRARVLSGDLDLGMALFQSSTGLGNYYQGRGQAVAVADEEDVGGTEFLVHETEVDDYFGLVLWNNNGNEGTYELEILGSAVASAEGPPVAGELALHLGENPSRGDAAIVLTLPRPERVDVGIYDVGGRRLSTLATGDLAAGVHPLVWDGRDESGASVGTGVYLARVVAGSESRTVKIVRHGS